MTASLWLSIIRCATCPGTLLSPHMGYVTVESYAEHFTQAVEDIAAFVDGAPLRVLAPS